MKRFAGIASVLAISMVCFAGCGCGDKEKDQAMEKWDAFKNGEIEKITAAYTTEDLKPRDFDAKVREEKGARHRFKGFLSFKRGNSYQEKSFAYVDGEWKPVDYGSLLDKKAIKKQKEDIEDLRDQIEELKEEIKEDEKDLEDYDKILIKIDNQKQQLNELEKKLEALTAKE